MYRMLKIGMDIYSTNYIICVVELVIGEEDHMFVTIKVTSNHKNILMTIENLKRKLSSDNQYDIQCGYEVGCSYDCPVLILWRLSCSIYLHNRRE